MELSNNLTEIHALVYALLTRIDVLEARVSELEDENKALKAENATLRVRLGMNSKNSHKPPSTDIFVKKPAIPVSKDKKKGGQKDHQGDTLKMVAVPDSVIIHAPIACSCCNRAILAQECDLLAIKGQVFDIPAPRLEVIEHRLSSVVCCGIVHTGVFPSQLRAGVQYGSKILTLSSLLNTEFRLPFRKISNLIETLYGYKFNQATAVNANERLFEALAPIEEEIKAQVLASEVVHFDETGLRVEGKLQWVHTACSASFCYLFLHPNRGKKALQSLKSVLKDYQSWAVHDCYASYFTFQDCKHAICNAHILRELQALKEQNSVWASQMHDFLLALYKDTEKGTQSINDLEKQAINRAKYAQICLHAAKEEPLLEAKARGKPKKSKGRNLLDRLMKYQEAVLAFAFEQGVPFTNNLAEQAIRHVKVKQKIAVFRTKTGAEVYLRIQGFINTVKKHAKNVFQELLKVNANQSISWKTT
jgi:transposase